jgi:hypothetical protein
VIPNLKLYLYAGCVVVVFGSGWYVHGVFTGHKILKLEAAYANERTLAAEHAAAQEAKSREVETSWRARVDAAQKEAADAVKVRDGRIATLNATNGKLQQRIAALASSGGSAEDSPSAASHLRNRLEALGPLVGELDSFAGEVSKYADALRDELMLCRQYAQAINDQKSF